MFNGCRVPRSSVMNDIVECDRMKSVKQVMEYTTTKQVKVQYLSKQVTRVHSHSDWETE
jgi:hypothetical protein